MRRVTIVIQDAGELFQCRTSLRIGAAEENIRNEYHFLEGVIKLNDDLDSDRTFADEIEDIIGEGIETLQFDGVKIVSGEREFIFTFVNGEKEFNFMILFILISFFRDFNPTSSKSSCRSVNKFI
jgi:hypothetical protein